MTTAKQNTFRSTVLETETPKFPSIEDIGSIEIDAIVLTDKHCTNNATGEKFTVQEFELDGYTYRMPKSVMINLRAILEKMSELEYFSVIKSGVGKDTNYTVVPVQEGV